MWPQLGLFEGKIKQTSKWVNGKNTKLSWRDKEPANNTHEQKKQHLKVKTKTNKNVINKQMRLAEGDVSPIGTAASPSQRMLYTRTTASLIM